MNKTKLLLLSLGALIFGAPIGFRTANAEGATGTHPGAYTRRATGAHSYTHLLVKQGADAFHIDVCGANDYPQGTTSDQPEAAEDIIMVNPLGAGTPGTRKVRVATAIAANIDLYTAASGFASALSATAGTYYKIGRSIALAVQVGTGDYLIEFTPCTPVATVVP
jgi:hypothetical protein